MSPDTTEEQKILQIISKTGAIRPRDLVSHGISRQSLIRLVKKQILVRPARGLYVLADAEVSEHHSLAEVAKLVPSGIVCLLSALRFHELTTQEPFEVWLALSNKAWKPENTPTSLRIVRFSEQALTHGVESHVVEGVSVNVFSPAKTVADCFKFRSTVGVDIAVEALKDCWEQKKATMDEIWEAAKACRMSGVMRPYMESLV
jgi:predicted transcriptional regulator of viral defense system